MKLQTNTQTNSQCFNELPTVHHNNLCESLISLYKEHCIQSNK